MRSKAKDTDQKERGGKKKKRTGERKEKEGKRKKRKAMRSRARNPYLFTMLSLEKGGKIWTADWAAVDEIPITTIFAPLGSSRSISLDNRCCAHIVDDVIIFCLNFSCY